MPESTPGNIFIVDDDPGLVRLIEKALKREHFTTATAGSGKEAIAWLAKNTAQLMLLDLKLKDIGGKELITHLAGIGRSVPFIIITGQGDERVAVEMMKSGALDYLVKDARFIEFVPTVVLRALEQLDKDKKLAAAQTALKESQEQLLAISEREQTRFGAELHDGLGQQLTAIELRCHSIKTDLPPNRPDLKKELVEICRFLCEAIAETRSLARSLSPVRLGSGGLVEALNELAVRMSKEGKIQCLLDCPLPPRVEDGVAGQLFRITQEALNNAVKHSGATEVVVRLTNNSSTVLLEISDNGRGLPETPSSKPGIGLQIMKHRASVIGAELAIKSKPGKGLTITCAWKAKKP